MAAITSALPFIALSLLLAGRGQGQDNVGVLVGSGVAPSVDKDAKCRTPPIIDNGGHNGTQFQQNQDEVVQGTVITFTCNQGFTLVGSPAVRCVFVTPAQQYNTSFPFCQANCRDPGIPANGRRIGDSFALEDSVRFECNQGFILRGTARRVCRDEGWSGAPVTCVAAECDDPGTPRNGDRSVRNFAIGAVVTYTCDAGYRLVGVRQRTCQPNRQWSSTLPSCQPLSCCQLEAPLNGRKTGDEVSITSVQSFTCNRGHNLVGSRQRTCQPSGTWSGNPARCDPILCPIPRQITNGGFTGNGFSVGSQLDFYCNNGYRLSGARQLTCRDDGTWSNPLPSCLIVNCGNPGIPENGERNGNDFTYTKQVSFSCRSGYRLLGSPVRFCQADGTWSGTPASCNMGSCGDPSQPENGGRTMTGASTGDTVTWTCNQGYRLVGQNRADCLPNGMWSQPLPICESIVCLDPGSPPNGVRSGTSLSVRARMSYTCNSGYMLEGATEIICQPNGRWSQPMPECTRLLCDDPGVIDNGFRTMNGQTVGSNVQYTCNPGFMMVGPMERTCVSTPGSSSPAWNNRLPVCVPITCPNPGELVNGRRTGDRFTYLSQVLFQCNSGYVLQGDSLLTCLANRSWSSPTPQCAPVRCPDPGQLRNGARSLTGTSFMDSVRWSCNAGYTLVGSPSAVCGADRMWSNPRPTCTLGECDDPGTPVNGGRIFAGVRVGSQVRFYCNAGYTISGSQTRVCRPDGTWSSNVPTCRLISCPDPGIPSNGERVGEDFSFAANVNFRCNKGYRLRGTELIICLATGQWSNPRPTCELIDCGDPGTPANGRNNVSVTTYGNAVLFQCNIGYRLIGRPLAICGESGSWSEPTPFCSKISCVEPGAPINGARRLTGVFNGDRVNWTCNIGYNLKGPLNAICQPDGTWSQPVPVCEVVTCPDPGTPTNGHGTPTGNTYGSTIEWACDAGYRPSGNTFARCQEDGTWSSPPPTCNPIDCFEPGVPVNGGRILAPGTVLNSLVTWSCNDGYMLQGEAAAVCLPTGRWSQPLPTCNPIDCGDPGRPANGDRRLDPGTTKYTDQVLFTCNSGYQLVGSSQATCLSTGNWSNPVPTCSPIMCPPVTKPDNGQLVSSSSLAEPMVETEVGFQCDQGYRLQGEPSITCMVSGLWSAPEPKCTADFCEDPGSIANGQQVGSNFQVGQVVRYLCNPGFSIRGPSILYCRPDQRWNDSKPSCDPDCRVGAWGPWGDCSTTCGPGNQTSVRPVTQTPSGNGKPCPLLIQVQACDLRECLTCENQYAIGEIDYRIASQNLLPASDVAIVVDESNSMNIEHEWLPGMVEALENNLKARGIGETEDVPNRYSLIGYGRRAPDFYAHAYDYFGELLFLASQYPEVNKNLYADPEGKVEDGYQAINYTLETIPFRTGENIAHNMILITDEDRDDTELGQRLSRSIVFDMLRQRGFILNVVVDNEFTANNRPAIGVDNQGRGYVAAGGGTYTIVEGATVEDGYYGTRVQYTTLAFDLRGAAWNIGILRLGGDVATSFTNAFTFVKTAEINRLRRVCRRCECKASGEVGLFDCALAPDIPLCECLAREGQYLDPPGQCLNPKPPQNCEVGPWSGFGQCSTTCGYGLSVRTRDIIQPARSGGTICPVVRSSRSCFVEPCPGANSCPDPGAPLFGTRSPSAPYPAVPGADVFFDCNTGFRRIGPSRAQCRSTGQWTGDPPQCRGDCIPGALSFEVARGDIATDVVLIVDESRSTQGEHAWLRDMVPDMDRQLQAVGIGSSPSLRNRFCQVGYGRSQPLGRIFRDGRDACVEASRYGALGGRLIADVRGTKEDGYEAIEAALRLVTDGEVRRQANVAINFLLVTDEDRDDLVEGRLPRETIQQRLSQLGIILNVVVDNTFLGANQPALGVDSKGTSYVQRPNVCEYTTSTNTVIGDGYYGTRTQYTDLAFALNGAAWDVNVLRRGDSTACAFTKAFIEVKSREILALARECQACRCNSRAEKECRRDDSLRNQCECVAQQGGTWDPFQGRCLPPTVTIQPTTPARGRK